MRYANWPSLLNKYITDNRDKEWEWGVWDCCVFTGGSVLTITGEDPMEEFRGKYHDEDSSNEVLISIGAGTLYKTLRRKFGKTVHGAAGKRGDVAFYEGCCGIVIGPHAIFIKAEGWGLVPMTHIDKVFRVI